MLCTGNVPTTTPQRQLIPMDRQILWGAMFFFVMDGQHSVYFLGCNKDIPSYGVFGPTESSETGCLRGAPHMQQKNPHAVSVLAIHPTTSNEGERTDGQTDRQLGEKTICLPQYGGDIISHMVSIIFELMIMAHSLYRPACMTRTLPL